MKKETPVFQQNKDKSFKYTPPKKEQNMMHKGTWDYSQGKALTNKEIKNGNTSNGNN